MPRRTLSFLTALAALLLMAPVGRAATSATYPSPTAQHVALGSAGWTATTTHSGICAIPGVTCPTVTAAHQSTGGTGTAPDGYLRTGVTTLAGLLSTGTATWTSPSFTISQTVDSARLDLSRTADLATLLSVNGSATMTATLVDTGTAARTTLIAAAPIAASGWSGVGAGVPGGALQLGHSYAVELRVDYGTPVSVAVAGSVGFDDIVLTTTHATPPAAVGAPTFTSDATGLWLTGTLDPAGLATTVHAEYGTTTSYGQSAGPVTLTGSGPTSYALPIAGLTPGQLYHARISATNADGTTTSTDISFTAPAAPTNAAPTVSGSDAGRLRTVTFDRDPSILSAAIEITAGGSVVATVAVPAADHTDVTLPDADGAYGIRVVRTAAGGSTTSAEVSAILDRAAPSTAGLALAVAPAESALRLRSVSFVRPSDAIVVLAEVIDAGGQVVVAPAVVAGAQLDLMLPALDGTYRVRLTLADPAGNTATAVTGDLVLDAQAPAAGPAPTVTGATSDVLRHVSFVRASDAAWVVVELLDGGGTVIGSQLVAAGNAAELVLPSIDGPYGVRVVQADAVGNTATSPTTVTSYAAAPTPTPTPLAPTPTPAPTPTAAPSPGPASPTPSLTPSVTPTPAPSPAAAGSPTPGALPDASTDASGGSAGAAGQASPEDPSSELTGGRDVARTPRPADATPPEGAAGTPGYVLATCDAHGIALTRVAMQAGWMRATGVSRFASGTPIELLSDAGTVVATTTARADGTFAVRIAATGHSAAPSTIRLWAKAGPARSRALRVERDNHLEQMRRHGNTVTLTGTLALRYRSASTRLVALGGRSTTGCQRGRPLERVGRAHLNLRTGRYRLRVRVPAGSGPVIARVRASSHAAGRTFSTYSVQ